MSAGLKLLRAIAETKSRAVFSAVKPDWFLPEERPAYDAMLRHIRRFGVIPDAETLATDGVSLPRFSETAEYHLSKVSSRSAFNIVNERHADFVTAMKRRDMDSVHEILRDMLLSVQNTGFRDDSTTMVEQARIVLEQYERTRMSMGLQGIPTGYPPLDEVTSGLQGGDLIVIAGRPNVGKSYKLLNIMKAAWDFGHPCLAASMEMGAESLARRMVGLESGLNPSLIRKGQLSTMVGEPLMRETIEGFRDKPPLHFVRGKFQKSIGDIDNAIQQFCPDICLIDAAYLLSPELEYNRIAKHERIGKVMEQLKGLADDRNIPIVVTVQLNRETEKRGKKSLDVSFLSGSDEIGQLATIVIAMVPDSGIDTLRRRRYEVVKNREDRLVSYRGQFSFEPMSFGYILGSSSEDIDGADEGVLDEDIDISQVGEYGQWE